VYKKGGGGEERRKGKEGWGKSEWKIKMETIEFHLKILFEILEILKLLINGKCKAKSLDI
jgi:hypothetical protein